MVTKRDLLYELDDFVNQHDITKFEHLNEYYLNLRKTLEYLWSFENDKNVFDTTLFCLKLESKVQLFIFYLDQISNTENLDIEESEVVQAIENEHEEYCLEMLNAEMIGNLSIFFKKKNNSKERFGHELSFKT